jgi:hypothetical protein
LLCKLDCAVKTTPETDPPLERVSLAASDYWVEDGIPALVAGAAYILIAGSGLGSWMLMVHFWPAWSWLTGSLALLWMPGAFISVVWFWQHREQVSEWLKARVTYPRTGYVAPPSYWSNEAEALDPALKWILDWLERHPLWMTLGNWIANLCIGILIVATLLSIFQILPKLEHALSYILRWAILVLGGFFLPWLVKSYARKIQKNKLYWMDIFVIPVFFLALMALTKKHEGLGVALFLLAPGIYMLLKGALFLARYLHLYRIPRA